MFSKILPSCTPIDFLACPTQIWKIVALNMRCPSNSTCRHWQSRSSEMTCLRHFTFRDLIFGKGLETRALRNLFVRYYNYDLICINRQQILLLKQNENIGRVVDLAQGCSTQSSEVGFVLQLSRYSRFYFGKSSLELLPEAAWEVLGGSLGVPGASLGGSEAGLGPSATHCFPMRIK